MPKINNSAVIQKLIDELNLYPGTDIIPTHLAEKIVPVFQVNAEEVSVTTDVKKATIIRTVATNALDTETIYTVEADGDFYLTNIALSVRNTAGNGGVIMKATIDGVEQQILAIFIAGADGEGNSLNLQNPIKIDSGSNITVTNSVSTIFSYGTVVGYYD